MGGTGIPGVARRARQPARYGLILTERDGYWHVTGTVRAARRGRRVRRSTGLPARPDTHAAAEAIRHQIEAEIRDELVFGIHPSVPLSVAAAAYLKRERPRPLNPIDVARIQELDRKFGARKLATIADSEWLAYIDGRTAGNAPATRERLIDLVLSFLKWCAAKSRSWLREAPEIERNRAARYRPRAKTRRVAEITPELVGRLVDHAAPHLKPIFAVMWVSGGRVSSVLYGCTLADYLAVPGREQITFHNTKNGNDVVVYLDTWSAGVMADYLRWRGRLHDRTGPLFLTAARRPYRPRPKGGGGQFKTAWRGMIRSAGRALRREALTEAASRRTAGDHAGARARWLAARAQLEVLAQLTPHWLRHLFATEMAAHPLDAMEQAAWEDIRSFKRYSHDVPDRRRALIAARPAPGTSPTLDAAAPRITALSQHTGTGRRPR